MTPSYYAQLLLHDLGPESHAPIAKDDRSAASLWAASGGQYLTGEADGPALPCPAPLASCAQGAWLALATLSDGILDAQFPAYQLLGERAAVLGLTRNGARSPGGGCHLLACADGHIAVNLPRPDDWQLVPAWLQQPADNWEDITRAVRTLDSEALVARARLLGLAAAPSHAPVPQENSNSSVRLCAASSPPQRTPLVVDLSALWAGPLCAQLLGQMGARVIKVESHSRPDGARYGPQPFFDLLNGNKQSLAVDLASESGRQQLHALLLQADIVIESNRPRALEQLGIYASDIVSAGSGRVWVSITGYGRDEPMRQWIAYGDDAGVAAGLSWLLDNAHGHPVFCGDAIADPLTGLHAALYAWAAWLQGGGVLLDVPLQGVLARCIACGARSGTLSNEANSEDVRRPHARTVIAPAPVLGFHTEAVCSEFGIIPR